MPKVSSASAADRQDVGAGQIAWEVIGGYEIDFFDLNDAWDGAPYLKGLPDDRCPCPHWGYVIDGTVTFTFADHTETFKAGDAFYVESGHTPASGASSKYVMFSPAELVAEVNEVVERNAKAMQSS